MVNVVLLKDTIKNKGFTVEQAASAIGINESTFYRKLNKEGKTFTLGQADILVDFLKLDRKTAHAIFFHQELA